MLEIKKTDFVGIKVSLIVFIVALFAPAGTVHAVNPISQCTNGDVPSTFSTHILFQSESTDDGEEDGEDEEPDCD